jgi:spore maturation protein CgeB
MSLFTRILTKVQASKNVTSSWAQKLIEERLFDSEWYLKSYPHITKKRKWAKQPIEHFLKEGGVNGYSPGVWFDSAWYLKNNKDVARAQVNPLVHYLSHGMQEGRKRSQVLTLVPDREAFQFFVVPKDGISWYLPIVGELYQYNLSTMFQYLDENPTNNRCGIVLIKCFGSNSEAIVDKVEGLSWSEHYKSWYRYLVHQGLQPITSDRFIFKLPKGTKFCHISVKPWTNTKFALRNTVELGYTRSALTELESKQSAMQNNAIRALVKASEIKVALIADEFTYNSFKDEFQPILLEPDSWKLQFEQEKPQLFFCESAWSGPDSKLRPWKGKIYASENFARENRQTLLDIIQYCRQNKIPTLFWNKEDPTHYTDRKHDFVKTAALFDYVFTSADECVEKYKNDYGLKHVYALPFATNPKLFSPFCNNERTNKIVFAGSWYANHIERSAIMEKILDGLIGVGFIPEIYDRYYGDTDPLHIWPDKYQKYIKPSMPHDQMPTVYKSSIFGLNFNTVTESSTMFARRVFELMSSNTLVISNYSKGVDEMFGDLVIFADKQPNRIASLSIDEIRKLRASALAKVLRDHTYKQRWQYILDCIDYKRLPENDGMTIVARISEINEAQSAISYFEQNFSRAPDFKLLLLVSSSVSDLDVPDYYQRFNRFGITVTSQSYLNKHTILDFSRLIETPFFAIFNAKTPPKVEWLRDAKLHASYLSDDLLTVANDDAYLKIVVGSEATLVGQSNLFLKSLQRQTSGEKLLAYTI